MSLSILPPRTPSILMIGYIVCLVSYFSRGKLVSPLTQSKLADGTVNDVDDHCHIGSLTYIRNINIG